MNQIQPAGTDSPATGTEPSRSGWDWRAISKTDIAGLAIVSGALTYSYWPNLTGLVQTWWREPDYTHGFLVLPIAIVIFSRLWPTPDRAVPRVWAPGFAMILAVLGLRAYLHHRGSTWSETATFLLVVVALAFARLGWRTMRYVWPAFAFLIFWLPLPPAINSILSQPLQSIATKAACGVLHVTGLWVMPEGNVIMVGSEQLEVAAACNGLSMLMSLAATVAATASIVPMANIKRLVLLASIIPIALASNVLRISATAWCYYHFGAKVGSEYAHDAAGWLMMPTAMAFVGLELMVMSWLIVESKEKFVNAFGSPYSAPRRPTLGEVRQ